MLSGKRIILGVTGGIAAYKAAFLLREFQKAGAEVRVTMTPSATRFVGTETFASLSRHDVAVEVFPESSSADAWTRHIEWGEWADLFVIAPCTANTLGKIVHGFSDNMLTSTVLAARCPILICPTMDGGMYQAPATQQNLQKVAEFGYHILEPEEGYLASGLEGKGRLPGPQTILKKAETLIVSKKKEDKLLSGKSVLVTAGPTREHIDPVRFISNPSTGKMGFAMAEAAQRLGADVTLIHGPVQLVPPSGVETIEIETAEQLYEKVREYATADVVIMSAAVSDFAPTDYHHQKVKKDNASSEIKLKSTPDILSWLGGQRRNGQVLIGFAMETENLVENATRKLNEKNIDWIVANSLSENDSGFGVDTNTVLLLGNGEKQEISGSKREVARILLDKIFAH
ncbi:bifunctional phosphopantothenoylcysteine decarboxylase/phosphopantothenate--cysteine ligase CoaBC [Aliifodinibius sp. S!AR15-10]|uniref:bifunctional phosphopantothenoylcysteine decarboxylase/phosphopantothenate--cysteine ligase CoaBC n=1 Tax=Aliifodinibius sp. S!AR15-10 TaxID=2950437 RepID=UPI002860FBE2|nr:bifunctional phosphopantothenoylcysteine decarboxylase/phosphopantothenate--cysteine ligase CoaBC [Aliifodinibius sp. S!AR15-10]MDR8391749.1 bifunctional phosphopantothenoylcysteine decarboxylase/phosphopantothenate--cysteine ligase CoaBC [Aliifodinibius sp. S!AR15-10]